ncbi:MAG: hypothetical protein U0Z26_07690 [Anaerolineales bacterium]
MQVNFDNLVISKPDVSSTTSSSNQQENSSGQTTNSIIYQDDFSTSSDVLQMHQGNDAITEVSNGVFLLTNKSNSWWISEISVPASDSISSVRIHQLAGPPSNNTGFGVMCRYAVSETGYPTGYLFAISGDGYASIQIIKPDGSIAPLVDWTASNLVEQAGAYLI